MYIFENIRREWCACIQSSHVLKMELNEITCIWMKRLPICTSVHQCRHEQPYFFWYCEEARVHLLSFLRFRCSRLPKRHLGCELSISLKLCLLTECFREAQKWSTMSWSIGLRIRRWSPNTCSTVRECEFGPRFLLLLATFENLKVFLLWAHETSALYVIHRPLEPSLTRISSQKRITVGHRGSSMQNKIVVGLARSWFFSTELMRNMQSSSKTTYPPP